MRHRHVLPCARLQPGKQTSRTFLDSLTRGVAHDAADRHMRRPDRERPLRAVLVANKTDLPPQRHQVRLDLAADWASNNGVDFFQVASVSVAFAPGWGGWGMRGAWGGVGWGAAALEEECVWGCAAWELQRHVLQRRRVPGSALPGCEDSMLHTCPAV